MSKTLNMAERSKNSSYYISSNLVAHQFAIIYIYIAYMYIYHRH